MIKLKKIDDKTYRVFSTTQRDQEFEITIKPHKSRKVIIVPNHYLETVFCLGMMEITKNSSCRASLRQYIEFYKSMMISKYLRRGISFNKKSLCAVYGSNVCEKILNCGNKTIIGNFVEFHTQEYHELCKCKLKCSAEEIRAAILKSIFRFPEEMDFTSFDKNDKKIREFFGKHAKYLIKKNTDDNFEPYDDKIFKENSKRSYQYMSEQSKEERWYMYFRIIVHVIDQLARLFDCIFKRIKTCLIDQNILSSDSEKELFDIMYKSQAEYGNFPPCMLQMMSYRIDGRASNSGQYHQLPVIQMLNGVLPITQKVDSNILVTICNAYYIFHENYLIHRKDKYWKNKNKSLTRQDNSSQHDDFFASSERASLNHANSLIARLITQKDEIESYNFCKQNILSNPSLDSDVLDCFLVAIKENSSMSDDDIVLLKAILLNCKNQRIMSWEKVRLQYGQGSESQLRDRWRRTLKRKLEKAKKKIKSDYE